MLMLRFGPRVAILWGMLLLGAACTRKTVSFSSRLDEPTAEAAAGDSLTTTKKKNPKLSIAGRKARRAAGLLRY